MSTRPQLLFASGVGTVTGANFFLNTGTARLLIDCGLIQGEKIAAEENSADFPYHADEIDALFITHAHLDHVGRIPKLVKEGFKGTIYSTPETRSLAELVLYDAVSILALEAHHDGRDPLYVREDVDKVFPHWKTVPYHQPFSPAEGVSIFFKDAGHILGSAMIEVTLGSPDSGETKILFTGDVGNSPAPILRDTEAVGEVDYLVMESVYGDRNHEARDLRDKKFEHIIKQTIDRGGTLVIPAFSIDRTQTLLLELNNLVEQKRIPSVPVYVDSPMATSATEVYKASEGLFNDRVKAQISRGDDIFSFKHLHYTVSDNDSRAIEQMHGPKIIMAGSGMSVGGRVIRHEEHFLRDPKNTILLVGYQTAGSLGRQLADGAKKVTIHGNKIAVKAQVETIFGFSAHKDSDHLIDFVATGSERIKQVFVVMGEPKSSLHLSQRINDELPDKAQVPEKGKWYQL